MRYRFYTCDVFTDRRFGGNPLAVLPAADGLSDAQMQQVAREFNYSETTFVLMPRQPGKPRVRIFTPRKEIPFAGHPNVGTAFVLAATGALGDFESETMVIFDEQGGEVPVLIRRTDGTCWCELRAPARLSFGRTVEPNLVAAALGLPADAIAAATHPPVVASVGLSFLIVELVDRAALECARIETSGFEAIRSVGVMPDIHLYTLSGDEFDIRARMFAPFDGVAEDPATGSANCALAGLLAHHAPAAEGAFRWRVAQGHEMGRPSKLEVRAEKRAGEITGTWAAGTSIMVTEGFIDAG